MRKDFYCPWSDVALLQDLGTLIHKSMEKQAYKKIMPLHYVYYVSHATCRESIEEKGLVLAYSDMNQGHGVFAHNAGYPDMKRYPFCFGEGFYWKSAAYFETRELQFMYFMMKYGHDFWQIDTHNEWFIDHYGMKDFYQGVNCPFLIIMLDSTPREALPLFYFHETPKVSRRDGVAHVEGYFRAAQYNVKV